MRHCCFWGVVLVLGQILLTGCRTAPATKPAKPSGDRAGVGAHPAEAQAHFAAAVIHELNDEKDQALDEYYQAALKDPDDEDLTLEVASRLLHHDRAQQALELLQAAARRPNTSGAIFARLGMVYARLDRNPEAVAANQLAIKKSPRLLAGYRNLFLNQLQSKRSAEALAVLDQAAKQSDSDAEFLVELAGLYENYTQRYPSQRQTVNAKTLAVLERAAKLQPASTHLKLQLADGFYFVGDMDKAAVSYLAVLDELGDLPQARELVRDRLMKIYLREGDRKRAVEQLQAIVQDNPANAQAYYFLGLIAYDQRRWTDMADYLKKTLLFSPNFEPAYYDLATAQLAAGKGEEALATLDSAKKKFPVNFKLEYGLGMASFQVKNFAEAVRHFSTAELLARAGETNLLTHAFYYQMGAAWERQGDHAQAGKCFEKCLQLAPDFEPAHYDLANVLIAAGQGEAAMRLLATAKEKFPPNFLLEYLQGAAQRQQKHYAEAVKYFLAAEAIAQAKDTNQLTHLFYFDVGAACERMGDRAQAEAFFEKCLKLQPDFSEAQNYLGYMWAERGEKLERAHELIAQALKSEPENPAYLDSMGWVRFKQNQPQEALDYILKAVKLSEAPDATLYDHLGDIYAAMNDLEKARDAWQKSLAVEKNEVVQKKLDASKKE